MNSRRRNTPVRSNPAPGAAVRAAAAEVGHAVDCGQSLDAALIGLDVAERDLPLLREMAYGIVRHRDRLDAVLDKMMDRPLPRKAGLLRALLRVGLYQLSEMRLPAHAAVHATVEACVLIEARHARGLINAVLRRYQREGEPSLPDAIATLTSHPGWMVDKLREDWPQWEQLLSANNQRAPMTLRLSAKAAERESLLAEFAAAEIALIQHPVVKSAVTLDEPRAVSALPGFEDGRVSVQDASAQLAALIIAPAEGEKILDACAAPGGKTGHLLECAKAVVTAVDVDEDRLQRVQENLDRLGRQAELIPADLLNWSAGDACFDAILLDAPCSGSGVIRRHPDIKWLRRASDIPQLAERQLAMLRKLWPQLKPGGRLLYAVCSVFAEEAEGVVSGFLESEDSASSAQIDGDWGEATAHGRRVAAGDQDMDGFYYALLTQQGC